MPATNVILYREKEGRVPFLEWFDGLTEKAQDKCLVRIERLRALGHELRRPEADLLRDGIHELRAKHGNLNYRMLYFFYSPTVVVLIHGVSKQRATVPAVAVQRAIERRQRFVLDSRAHTYEG